MKVVILLIALMVSYPSRALTYDQLDQFSQSVSRADCPNIDQIVYRLERELHMRGLLGADPEMLNSNDRQFNSLARIIIWNLRIGCSNPGSLPK